MNLQEEIGMNIRLIRTKHKLTQEQFAAKIIPDYKNPQMTISLYETGRCFAPISFIMKVCEEFNVDLYEIIPAHKPVK